MKHHHDIHIAGVLLPLGAESDKRCAQMPASTFDILDKNCRLPLESECVKKDVRNEA